MKLINDDCMVAMTALPDGCVDLVLCDLPYGTTATSMRPGDEFMFGLMYLGPHDTALHQIDVTDGRAFMVDAR